MGTVIINGKEYDAVTGLQIDMGESVAQIVEEVVEKPVKVAPAKVRKLSRQEKMAKEIAREFDEIESHVSGSAELESDSTEDAMAPDWLQQFAEQHASQKNQVAVISQTEPAVIMPDWIANYADGGAPVEIEPIGLAKVSRDTQIQPTNPAEIRISAQNISRHIQHSATLNRRFVKKPEVESTVDVAAPMPVTTHPLVHKFNKSTVPVRSYASKVAEPIAKTESDDEPFRAVLTRAQEESLASNKKTELVREQHTASHDLKNALIREQLNAPIDPTLSEKEQKRTAKFAKHRAAKTGRRFSFATIMTTAVAVMLIGGFVTYTQMPNISVRVAAVRAGVDAKNPYMPNGYSVNGPVAYAPGMVTINYKSNGGGNGYTLTQANSSWDSGAVLDNLVAPTGGNNYQTLTAKDGTVYRYGDDAAWVNSGVLYTLNGNGTMSNNQILQIANSI